MSGYTKLFGSILESTVWGLPCETRLVWITMLAMASRDGVVEASVPGLARRAQVSLEDCEVALATFLGPDPYSRTSDHEGRRIEVVDGGWRLLNYAKYRERLNEEHAREKNAEYQRAHRAKKGRRKGRNLTVPYGKGCVRENKDKAEAEAEANANAFDPPKTGDLRAGARETPAHTTPPELTQDASTPSSATHPAKPSRETDHGHPRASNGPSEAPPPVDRPNRPWPAWFDAACDAVETALMGETIERPAAWLRYEGHRSGSQKGMSQKDAQYWLTAVDIKEARKEREERRRREEREARWDKQREKPTPFSEPQKIDPAQEKKFAAELAARVRERKERERKERGAA